MKRFLFILLLPLFAHAQVYTPAGGGTWMHTADNYHWGTAFSSNGFRKWYQSYQVDSAEINNGTSPQTANFDITGTGTLGINTLGTTTSPAISLLNNTAATSLAQQVSPSLLLGGQGWASGAAASEPVNFQTWVIPSAGGSPSGSFILGVSVNGSAPSQVFSVSGFSTVNFSTLNISRETLSGSNDAATGLGTASLMQTNIGATNNNDLLVGLDLANTYSNNTGLATVKNITGGSGYVNGTYTNVPIVDLTNTSHATSTIAQATVVVSGNAVVSVTPTTYGGRYTVNNNLTVSASAIGGTGSGFTCQVATLHTYTGTTGVQAMVGPGGVLYVPDVFANAPANPHEGTVSAFTDSMTNTWGATITGGGSDHVFGYFDGTNWTVMAK